MKTYLDWIGRPQEATKLNQTTFAKMALMRNPRPAAYRRGKENNKLELSLY